MPFFVIWIVICHLMVQISKRKILWIYDRLVSFLDLKFILFILKFLESSLIDLKFWPIFS